jgi:hypothetical protein
MPKKFTFEELKNIVHDITNNKYTIVGDYINNRTKTTFKHLLCNTEFIVTPKDFKNGKSRCPKCAKEKLKKLHLKSSDTFKNEFDKKSNGNYELLTEYEKSNIKIKIKHLKCNTTFNVTPNNFLSKSSGCPKCFGNEIKTTKQFIEEIEILGHGEYKLLSEYKGRNKKVVLFHLECNNTFKMSPDKFIIGQRCTVCKESIGESKIRRILTNKNINFSKQYRFNDCRGIKYPLSFDFAIFKDNNLSCLIEYDGEQHFRPVNFNGISDDKALELFNNVKVRDSIKTNYCLKNNIKLFRIKYTSFDDLENEINVICQYLEL